MIAPNRPIARPRFWLGLWLLAVAVVWLACLLPPPPLPELPANTDKWQHLLAYFLLAGSGVQLWCGRAALCRLGAGLLLMGLAIELAQGALTATRQADAGDLLANALGVGLGLLLATTPLSRLLQWLQPAARGIG